MEGMSFLQLKKKQTSYVKNNISYICFLVAQHSSVNIATSYWLDVPVIRCRWGARFSAPLQTTLEPT